jgi:hypothetical protein
MFHLLRARCGPGQATTVSRNLLIDGRQSQTLYMARQAMAYSDDLTGRIPTRLESSLPSPLKEGGRAHEFYMSKRTLKQTYSAKYWSSRMHPMNEYEKTPSTWLIQPRELKNMNASDEGISMRCKAGTAMWSLRRKKVQ